jgi:hypothetical protein
MFGDDALDVIEGLHPITVFPLQVCDAVDRAVQNGH